VLGAKLENTNTGLICATGRAPCPNLVAQAEKFDARGSMAAHSGGDRELDREPLARAPRGYSRFFPCQPLLFAQHPSVREVAQRHSRARPP